MKDKDFKRWLKRKIKVTLGVMISFLILGKLGYADTSTEELNNAKEQLKKAKEEHSAAKGKYEEVIEKLNELLSQFQTNKVDQKNKVEANGYDSYAVGGRADGHMSVVYGFGSKIIKEKKDELDLGGVGASIFGPYNLIKIEDLKDSYKNVESTVGVANSIVGIANITENSNGSLIFGAGNKITNSYRQIPELDGLFQKILELGMQGEIKDEDIIKILSGYVSKSGGSVLAIGGGNNADYAQLSKITGVGNEIKGTENNISRFDMIDGHNNIINEGSYNAIIGTNYDVEKSGRNILYGFNKEKNIIKNSNIVSIGNDIEVTEDNSVYLGNNSKSSVNKNSTIWISNDEIRNKSKELNDLENEYKQKEADYEKELSEEIIKQSKQNSQSDKTPDEIKEDLRKAREEITNKYNTYKEEYKERYEGELKELKEEYKKLYSGKYSEYKDYAGFNNIGGIVTVGNDTLTRVIQNVAPGLISKDSTDAINGSQLYNYVAKQYITVKDGKGGETKIKLGDTLTLKGTTVDVTVEGPKSEQTNNTSAQTNTTSQSAPSTSTEPKVSEHTATFEAKGKFEYVLREGDTEKVLSEEEYSKLKSDEKKNVILCVKDGEKVITNVANGVKANDAVNVSQLNDVKSKLQNDIKEVDKKSDLALGGVSNAVAMANLPQVMGDKKFNLAASYGYYGGSHAIAVGFSGTNDKQNFIYKLSGSVNNKGNLAFGIGAGVMLGEVNNKDKKIEDLTKENKEIKENLRNQSAEIQELKEIVRRLMKK